MDTNRPLNLAEKISKIAESIPVKDRVTDLAVQQMLVDSAELSLTAMRLASGDFSKNPVRDHLAVMTELLPQVVKPDIKRVFDDFTLRK